MDVEPQVLERVRQELEEARKEAITFAWLTVALTPLLLAASAGLFALGVMLVAEGYLAEYHSTQAGLFFAVVFLAVALVSTFSTSSGEERSALWRPAVAIAFLGGVVLVGPGSYVSEGVFLGLCGGIGFVALALMGRAYTPKEEYYLGTYRGNNPLTASDDVDRAHVATGCAVALPAMVVCAFGEIFSSRWLWGELDDRVVRGAARLLVASDQGRSEEVVRRLGYERPMVLNILKRAQLVRIAPRRITITEKGHEVANA